VRAVLQVVVGRRGVHALEAGGELLDELDICAHLLHPPPEHPGLPGQVRQNRLEPPQVDVCGLQQVRCLQLHERCALVLQARGRRELTDRDATGLSSRVRSKKAEMLGMFRAHQ
jgi:hypothetical protein